MPADVLVVGGGVIGLSIAWESARRGRRVTVLDPEPGRAASWAAAGMLAPVTEASFGEERLVRMHVEAAARWPAFAERLSSAAGVDPGYRTWGTVAVAVDGSDRAAVDQLLAHHRSLGLESTRLSASECRSLVPALAPGIRGGASVPGDHQVDNRRFLQALIAGCESVGVALERARVLSVELDAGGAARGVRLEDGTEVAAGTVVLAAGVGSPTVAGLPDGVVPPVRPVKGQILRLRSLSGAPLLGRTVRGLVHGRPCYLVPRDDGSLVVGATSEERGSDLHVQAGAVYSLLDDARTLVPGLDELELVECTVGLRPGSPDNAPWVGPSAVGRLVVATGHYRNGFLLAPLTAESVADYLDTGSVPPPLDEFGVGRSLAAA